ncbi:MAG TPA: Na+/H+ antiporter NhaA [Puia sp.]|nr:Na+/H+ antiporter NhaA [Puia sp.]
MLLIGCTAISIVITNTSTGGWYHRLWNTENNSLTSWGLPGSLLEWINNFLMAFFFVLAATEIKRELLNGELSTVKKAILPFGAALGGMLVPALIFIAFNFHTAYRHGWGIPTATDIAFSLGAASLLGKRFPVGLKILLMALAIIDDLGAILVIALFYGGNIHWQYLGMSGLIYGFLWLMNLMKIKFSMVQVVLGFFLWYLMLQSGVEAAISGVLFAFVMPVDALAQIEKKIHKIVNFGILPLFALANTAILFPADVLGAMNTSVGMGIAFGLVIGKPLGIFLVSRAMVALNLAHLPTNVRWNQLLGMGMLAGIGFTMSIFTTMLAFGDESFRDVAKISILTAVVASVLISYLYFRAIGVVKHVSVPVATLPLTEQSVAEQQLANI